MAENTTINSIDQLNQDSADVMNWAQEWVDSKINIMETIAKLRSSWAGKLSTTYTDKVLEFEPFLNTFADQINILGQALNNASKAYANLEEGDYNGFNDETNDLIDKNIDVSASTANELTFSPAECEEAASKLETSANTIDDIIKNLNNSISSITANYDSPAAEPLENTLSTLGVKAPEFVDTINELANCLRNEIAPAYTDIEASAVKQAEDGIKNS